MDMADTHLIRVIRTASSERYVFSREGQSIASLDLHFLEDGKIDGHLTLLTPDYPADAEIQEFIALITDTVLAHQPHDQDPITGEERLHITVTRGVLIGNYAPG